MNCNTCCRSIGSSGRGARRKGSLVAWTPGRSEDDSSAYSSEAAVIYVKTTYASLPHLILKNPWTFPVALINVRVLLIEPQILDEV